MKISATAPPVATFATTALMHLGCALVACLTVCAQPTPRYDFTELGIGYPFAINNAGDAVGWGDRADVVRKGVPLKFTFPGVGIDINNAGEVAVQTEFDQYLQTAVWRDGVLHPLPVENWITRPFAINNAGVVVGATALPLPWFEPGDPNPPPQRWLAVSWTKDGAYRLLGALAEDHSSHALDINNRGQVVGTSWPTLPAEAPGPQMRRPVLFENGRLIDLRLPPGTDALTGEAVAINDRGQILVNCLTVGYGLRSYIYFHGKFTDLGLLPTQYFVQAIDINNSGDVVGVAQVGLDEHAFLYSKGQLYDLNDLAELPPGCILATADSINDRGEIIGFAFGNFNYQGYLLTPRHPLPAR